MAVIKYKKANGEYATITNYNIQPIVPVATTGTSATDIMSQKAVSDALAEKVNKTDFNAYSTTTNDEIGKKVSNDTYTAYTAATDTKLANAVKVDDVKVNGTSVVTNKIASIDLSGYAKTDTVNTALGKKLDSTAYTPYDDTEVRNLIKGKQDSGNYVSATTLNNYYTKAQSDTNLAKKVDSSTYTTDKKTINDNIATKQNKLTAGDGIKIDAKSNTISTTLDTTIFRFVQSLPTENIESNKLYFVPSSVTGANNVYTEYAYNNNSWEIIGQYKANVDLTPYAKVSDVYSKTDADKLLNTKADASVLGSYYTKDEIDAKGYLTKHQDISGKLDTSAYNTDKAAIAASTKTALGLKVDTSAYTANNTALNTAIDGKVDNTVYKAYTADTATAIDKKQNKLTIDTALDATSENVVQNKAVATNLSNLSLVISGALNDLNDRLTNLSAKVAGSSTTN